jgi:hypothetical protein
MKIGGIDPSTLSSEEILVLPRGNDAIVFRAVGIPNYDAFQALCPEPKAPGVMKAGEGWTPNTNDPGYRDMVKTHDKRRISWMVITSLEPSEIEWDTVDLDNPSTWDAWVEDLRDAGLNQVEINRVQALVFQANSLDETKLQKAREVFLLGQAQELSEYSGQSTAPENSPSGEPASV